MNEFEPELIFNPEWQKKRQLEGLDLIAQVRGDRDFVPPAASWYTGLYYWDVCWIVMFQSKAGKPDDAVRDLRSLGRGIRENGMIPHHQPDTLDKNRANPESWLTYIHPDGNSHYTQPQLMAKASLHTFRAFEKQSRDQQGKEFLKEIYPVLLRQANFMFTERTDGSDDYIAKLIHPCESGRDSDPVFDGIKPRIPVNGKDTRRIVDLLNPGLDYLGNMKLAIQNRLDHWDLEKAKERFWYSDPMFASIFANDLNHLSQIASVLGDEEQAKDLKLMAKEASRQIQDKLLFDDPSRGYGVFRAIDTNGEPVDEISITSLGPLMLDDLTPENLENITRLMKDDFNTPFVLPTVGTSSKNFDPHYHEKMIMWRGPVWIWINHLVSSALKFHSERLDIDSGLRDKCKAWARKIDISSVYLTKDSFDEQYNPLTSEAQRTKNFVGAVLGAIALK